MGGQVTIDQRKLRRIHRKPKFDISHHSRELLSLSTQQLLTSPFDDSMKSLLGTFVALSIVPSCSLSEITGGNGASYVFMLIFFAAASVFQSWTFTDLR